MADGVHPTEEDLRIARQGIATQFKNLCPLHANAETMELHFGKFLEQQAQVIANERAYSRMLQNALHEKDGMLS